MVISGFSRSFLRIPSYRINFQNFLTQSFFFVKFDSRNEISAEISTGQRVYRGSIVGVLLGRVLRNVIFSKCWTLSETSRILIHCKNVVFFWCACWRDSLLVSVLGWSAHILIGLLRFVKTCWLEIFPSQFLILLPELHSHCLKVLSFLPISCQFWLDIFSTISITYYSCHIVKRFSLYGLTAVKAASLVCWWICRSSLSSHVRLFAHLLKLLIPLKICSVWDGRVRSGLTCR